jgi:phenazine biosynthesis protein PhzF family
MQRRFTQVDVFGPERDGFGNPLAVVVDGAGLSDAQMAAFAAWTNLSETVFLLPPTTPEVDYRVRIFTIDNELPFAGHPTLGSAFAWLAAGGVARRPGGLVQECGVGLVQLRTDGDRVAFAAPPRRRVGPLSEELVARAEAVIGVPRSQWVAHEWGDNGPPWMMIELADASAVREVRFDTSKLGALEHLGLIGRDTGQFAYEVRGQVGAWEDPVTGSLNASVAQWLRARGVVPSDYVATQGSQLGRRGEIFVHDDGTDIWIGGRVRPIISGTVEL